MSQDGSRVVIGQKRESLPSRFSALLQQLAHVPEAEIGTGWDRALTPGAVIGRFELVKEVGRGGFGVVYEALDKELGRTVAFKAVRAGVDLDFREERLLQEAEAAARLSHPNIVTLFDVGRSEQGPYLVLEFLRGETLAQRVEQGPIPVGEALRIAVEVAKALAHAHSKSVVHRDLTPGNVFLCEGGQVKVLDFGMAHAFGRRRLEGGTPGYMAPEQLRGAPEDERTDVFALGVILYRLLAGQPPYRTAKAAPDEVPPVLHVPGAPSLGSFVASMLEQDPVRRPRDVNAVLASLTESLRELERTPSDGKVVLPKRRRPAKRRALAAVLAAIAVLALGVASWTATRRVRSGPPIAAASIAVLPFVDLTAEKDQEYFSDGLADEILNALAQVDGLRVPGRTSCFFFKGKNARLADIGRELKVGAVLEGSVRKAGNRVRVTAEVVNVRDGYRLWSQTYDRELTDIFAVQDDIARSVVAALDVKLLGKPPSSSGHATSNPEVYAQYLIGRQQYHRLTREGLRLAVEAYEKALSLDPEYAPAWAGMVMPLYYLAQLAETPAAMEAQLRRAIAAAEKAVALAPDLADALSTRGTLRGLIERDWNGAKADLERAISLNGNDPDARRRYGALLHDIGQIRDAITEVRKAVDLDPLGQSWITLGMFYQDAGELDHADAAFRRHLEISPDAATGLEGLGRNLLLQSKPKEALATFERCREEIYVLWAKAVAEHTLGHPTASQAALQALISRHPHASAIYVAEAYAWRGEKDSAFEWLEKALTTPGGVELYRFDPFLRSLRDDPRYRTLLRKMNLPVE